MDRRTEDATTSGWASRLGLVCLVLCVIVWLVFAQSAREHATLWFLSGAAFLFLALVAQVIATAGPRVALSAATGDFASIGHLGQASNRRATVVEGAWALDKAAPLAHAARSAQGTTLRLSRVPALHDDERRDLTVEALRVANEALTDEVAQRQAIVDSLLESERRYRQVVDSLPDMVVVCRLGHIVFMNSTGARMAGLSSADESIGMRFGDLVEPSVDDFAEWHAGVVGSADDPEHPIRARLMRTDGRSIEVEVSSSRGAFQDEDAVQFIVRDISCRSRSEELMRKMAFHDALTELPNRALFMDRLSRSIAQARRDEDYVAVAFLDLDGFKKINDELGHDAGDDVLVEVADRLSKQLRDEDTIARHGGDEFTVVARLAEPSDAVALAERLLDALRPEMEVMGRRVTIGASVGIAVYPYDGEDEADLLRCADAAMYASKAHEGSAYQISNGPIMLARSSRPSSWMPLFAALAAGELEMRYSPTFDLDAERFVEVEALPYWKHPSHGWMELVAPVDLVTGHAMPEPLLDWLVSSACAVAVSWQANGLDFGRISIRLNAQQVTRSGTAARILCALDRAGLAPDHLGIAIAETAALVDTNPVCDELSTLSDRGVKVAIDGLGEASASMCCLTRFSAEALRISSDLVAGLQGDPGAAIIIGTLIDLSCDLGLEVVADGVENASQVMFLRERGCRLIQGPFVGGTVSAEEAAAILGVEAATL